MTTDDDLINSALNATLSSKKKLTLQEFDDFDLLDLNVEKPVKQKDALTTLTRRVQRREKQKRKPIAEWSSKDFYILALDILKTQKMYFHSSGIIALNEFAGLYDKFVERLGPKMECRILKEYIEWWCSVYLPQKTSQKVYVQDFGRDNCIDRYLKYVNLTAEVTESPEPVKSDPSNVPEDEVYKTGGLPMLLMSRGIVVAYRVLLKNKVSSPMIKITSELRKMSRDMFIRSLETTLASGPYPDRDRVDFISLSRSVIEMYKLEKKYMSVDYKGYFGGKK